MRRSRLVVCVLGFAILWGTVVSLAGDPPAKSAGSKQPGPARKAAKTAAPVCRTGVEAIEAALAKPIDCEFVETPLKDVIEFFKDKMQVEIYLDSPALKEAGVDESTPVNCNFHGLRFEKVLKLVLESLQLKSLIHDDVLYVTSPAKAESDEFLEDRMYDVGDLVVYLDDKGRRRDDFTPLTDLITNAIDTKTWMDNGGTGTIGGCSLGTEKILVVSNGREVHKKIAALLAEVRVIAAKKTGGDSLPRYNARPFPEAMRGGMMGMGAAAGGTGGSLVPGTPIDAGHPSQPTPPPAHK